MKDLDKLLEGRIETNSENVFVKFYTNTPLFQEDNWDYAIIVELEQDKKSGRASIVRENGKIVGSVLISEQDKNATIKMSGDYENKEGLYYISQTELQEHLNLNNPLLLVSIPDFLR
jgi:hypothetical protein